MISFTDQPWVYCRWLQISADIFDVKSFAFLVFYPITASGDICCEETYPINKVENLTSLKGLNCKSK